jgi:outer membrane protein assembly factor BamB
VVNSGRITCTFDLTGAALGLWSVTVTNLDSRSGTLPSAFRVTANAPVITSITPNKGDNTGPVAITNLAGNYFSPGMTVKLSKSGESDIIADHVVVESPIKITCSFDLTQKTVGFWDVTVTNTEYQSGTLTNGFEIQSPTFRVTVPIISEKNPFDPGSGPTKLKYSLSRDHEITIYIFNIRGERIWQYRASAGAEGGKAGVNEVLWDGMTAFSTSASNGVYLVRLTAKIGGQMKTISSTKIALIKQ